jgi:hypothetical protein
MREEQPSSNAANVLVNCAGKEAEQQIPIHNLPRVLSSVLGQQMTFLESLDKLKQAQPQLASEIQHLEGELYSFSLSALNIVSNNIDVDFALELMKPKLPTVTVHKAMYGPRDNKFDVTWILKKFIFNSVL